MGRQCGRWKLGVERIGKIVSRTTLVQLVEPGLKFFTNGFAGFLGVIVGSSEITAKARFSTRRQRQRKGNRSRVIGLGIAGRFDRALMLA